MGIKAVDELPRGPAERRFGEPPRFERRWAVEVDDPTTAETDVVNAVPVVFLDPHPEAPYCRAWNVGRDYLNGNRWLHVVTWRYEVPKQANFDPNPLARPDIWKWSTGGVQIPALTYYDEATDAIRALVNTAGDFFEGLTEDEPTLTASISGNRATYDYALATSIHGGLNSVPYLGGAAYTWKVDGIAGEPAVEIVNEQEIRYWKVEAAITFKASGWPLRLPNIGWNYVSSGQKKRVYVLDPDTNEKVPATNPQALDSGGGLVVSSPGESNPPLLLTRRTKPRINFQAYFGLPPQ
jgi:hypothetical protein